LSQWRVGPVKRLDRFQFDDDCSLDQQIDRLLFDGDAIAPDRKQLLTWGDSRRSGLRIGRCGLMWQPAPEIS
jgi:hypothetical protein